MSMGLYVLCRKYKSNNNEFTIILIRPDTMREISAIKKPCINQSIFVIAINNSECKDTSFTLFVLYILCNWGNN